MEVDFEALRAPMPESAIDWRVQKTGTGQRGRWASIVPYADARYLMDRLDECCGPERWQTHATVNESGVVVGLGIYVDELGEWIWKADGAGFTDFAAVKGGLTHAFRRACVPWNIAGIRLLYSVEGPIWAKCYDDEHEGAFQAYDKDNNTRFSFDPPQLYGPNGLLTNVGVGVISPVGSGSPRPSEPGSGLDATQQFFASYPERGKHSESGAAPMTWREVVLEDPRYIEWALEAKPNFITGQHLALLGRALERTQERRQAEEDDGYFDEPADDRPY